ncbi:MBL fold metallo-hydrolase [Dyella flagellata]|uniref:MBL fold metallo-hydrolase n=1 Tax=Dyella flagellata TaxID=1867833 RepID=A0ABQ5XIK4_9GAMM|nr:MBL fold metallo-hydrolase [Dyella flagellata]GLQ90999.1 MBL fold metallo-hydrolase [Dyella flagellata]
MSTKQRFVRAAMITALLLGGMTGTAFVESAYAAAPMVKTSAPAYYRMMLGDFEVTALSDGTTVMPVQNLLTHTTAEKTRQMMAASFVQLPYEMNFNAFLVNTGTKLVLIDTGTGAMFGSNLGKLVARLQASGYKPEQVDEIYITHMHPDHIGGLVEHGERVFPNAIVRANQGDADFWLSQAQMDKAPKEAQAHFKDAMEALNPYIQAGRFKPFQGDIELTPGIRSVSLAGHTPGHTGYMIQSKGQKMLVWGDIVHVPAVQFAHPDITIHFDTDSAAAEAMREHVLADAAKQGYYIAGAHLIFPAIGHVRKAGSGYEWVPVSYTELH